MGNHGTHRYTATTLYFTLVNLYIEFKQSLKDNIHVTGEVLLLGEGLLIGWGTSVSVALSSRQVQRCQRAWLYITSLLASYVGCCIWGNTPICLWLLWMQCIFLCWSQWRNILHTVRCSDDQYHICNVNLWGSPGFNSNYNSVTRLSQGQFQSFKSELPLFWLTSSHSHVLLPSLLHQHLHFNRGSHSQLL